MRTTLSCERMAIDGKTLRGSRPPGVGQTRNPAPELP